MTNIVRILAVLADKNPNFGRTSASLTVAALVEKLGDAKIKRIAGDALTAIATSTSLQFVFNEGIYSSSYEDSATFIFSDLISGSSI